MQQIEKLPIGAEGIEERQNPALVERRDQQRASQQTGQAATPGQGYRQEGRNKQEEDFGSFATRPDADAAPCGQNACPIGPGMDFGCQYLDQEHGWIAAEGLDKKALERTAGMLAVKPLKDGEGKQEDGQRSQQTTRRS